MKWFSCRLFSSFSLCASSIGARMPHSLHTRLRWFFVHGDRARKRAARLGSTRSVIVFHSCIVVDIFSHCSAWRSRVRHHQTLCVWPLCRQKSLSWFAVEVCHGICLYSFRRWISMCTVSPCDSGVYTMRSNVAFYCKIDTVPTAQLLCCSGLWCLSNWNFSVFVTNKPDEQRKKKECRTNRKDRPSSLCLIHRHIWSAIAVLDYRDCN